MRQKLYQKRTIYMTVRSEDVKQNTVNTMQEMQSLFEKRGVGRRKGLNTPLQLRHLVQTDEYVRVTSRDFLDTEVVTVSSEALSLKSSPVHSHDFYELAFVKTGNYYVTIEDKEYTFSEGDLLLLNRNTKHTERNNFTKSANFYLCFEESFLVDYAAKFGGVVKENGVIDHFIKNNTAKNILNNKDYIVFKPIGEHNAIDDVFSELESVFDEKPNYMQAAVYYLIGKLFGTIEDGRLYKATYVDLGNFPELKIAESARKMISDKRGIVTREEIALFLGYSENHVYRSFKKIYGTSIKEYAQSEKIKHAQELLRESSLSITEIASVVGIENRTQFYKLFEKTFGCTPKEYRERLKSAK